MLFKSKSKETKKEIEKLLSEVQMNLENNYKDLAISAFKASKEKVEEANNAGLLKEKDYKKYLIQLKSFEKRMEGYSHRLKVNW